MPEPLLIQNGRLIDPSQEIDEVTDVLLVDGHVEAIGKDISKSGVEVIDASGQIVCPGLIDMHVHLREPGFEHKETIESGTSAAVAGGFTAVACMPNTDPPLHDDTQIEYVLRQAARVGHCRVYPIGALTKHRAGKELAEIGLMVRAGAVAFSDDGDGIADAGVCLQAMKYVSMFNSLLIQHCEDRTLTGGCMNAGPTATRLGLPGMPGIAEEVMAARDVALAKVAGTRYHVAHASTAGMVEIVRRARAEGLPVSTEVCPHHLLLTDEACTTYDPNTKMSPPLRSAEDVDACLEGVRDGTIEALITDHAPHTPSEKEVGFQDAPFGILGLETSLALFAKALVDPGLQTWAQLIHKMSTRPAELLQIPGGTLRTGTIADVTVFDPEKEWTIDLEQSRSKSRNHPFDGWQVRCPVSATIVGGTVKYRG